MNEIPIRYVELEAIHGRTLGAGMRTLAVTSANPGEGVTMLARALARRSAAAGKRTLLIDFNLFRPTVSEINAPWRPEGDSARSAVLPLGDDQLYGLPVSTLAATELSFRDPAVLRRAMAETLSDYDAIVIDTSSVNAANARNVPAEVAAAACEAAILVIRSGSTTGLAAKRAVDRLLQGGANLVGVAMNDLDNPTLCDELCREVNRLRRFAPRVCDWIVAKFRASEFLRIQT